jgi:hypothetical protein
MTPRVWKHIAMGYLTIYQIGYCAQYGPNHTTLEHYYKLEPAQ